MRRGATTATPGFRLPATGVITNADLQRVLAELVVQLNLEGAGDQEIADMSFAKLISGILTRADDTTDPVTMKLSGKKVILQSSDYVKDTQHFYDGVVTGGSPGIAAISSAKAVFSIADVGGRIQAPVFPDGTLITGYTSPAIVTTSNVPTESATEVAFILPDRPAGTGWAKYGDGHEEVNNPADPAAPRSTWRGNIESLGLRTLSDGSLEIGLGQIRLRATPEGDFIFGFGAGGAVVGITHDGTLFVGGSTLADAVASFDNVGNFALKNTSQSLHDISLAAINPTILAPQADPPGGAFDTSVSVGLFSQSQHVSIFYTTDGSAPSTASTLYTGRFAVSATTTVKAIAYWSGVIASPVSTFVFTLDSGIVPNPQFNPAGGTYTPVMVGGSAGVMVRLSCSLVGSSIRYTIDGSNPTPLIGDLISPASGAVIPTSTFRITPVAGVRTMKAIAFKAGKTDSGVVTEVYHITAGGGGGGYPGGGGRGNVP